MATIELRELTRGEVRSLSGQERGATARVKFRVDELDGMPDPIVVKVPDDLDSISPSFLRGMFSLSILALTAPGFLSHYIFDAKPQIIEQVQRAVNGTILDNSPI